MRLHSNVYDFDYIAMRDAGILLGVAIGLEWATITRGVAASPISIVCVVLTVLVCIVGVGVIISVGKLEKEDLSRERSTAAVNRD